MPLSFVEARQLILDRVSPLSCERVFLLAACNRALAETICAPFDLPAWDNSAMDGFAVRASDSRSGAVLKIDGYLPAGARGSEAQVTPGCAVRIMTGAPIPAGADAVVPFEEAVEADGTIRLAHPVAAGDHIRRRGSDVRCGDPVLPAGTLIRPAEINMLATFGIPLVSVHRRPRVAIVSTGDELVDLGETAGPGQIVNSNSYSLAAAVLEAGGEPILLGIARDNRDSTREKLAAGLEADVLITSAGVSAGDRDLVRDVLAELGVEQLFWKIDIKPGRPTAFGVRGAVPVFSLPGNPVSTIVTFEFFVRPALLRMAGHPQPLRPTVRVRLLEKAKKRAGRVQFLRVQVHDSADGLVASSSGDQNTGIVRTMVRANGIAILPAELDEVPAGSVVELLLVGPLEPARATA